MNTRISALLQIIRRKEALLFLILFLTGISLIGWLSGNNHISSFSVKYIPIAPSSLVMFISLAILFLMRNKIQKSQLVKSLSTIIILIITVYCSIIFLEYCFKLTWDIEYILLENPEMFGNVPIGRMSPIASVLFVLICISILGIQHFKTNIFRYVSGGFSLLTGIVASVLLIGYLYKAPLLYGSNIIPVSLPSAICFLIFSITLLRVLELKFWSFNLLKDNKVTRQLLRAFLPIVIFIVILQGFLDNVLSFNDINPPLTSALILFSVVLITVVIVFRVSSVIGAQLLRAEEALKESEKKLIQLNADKDRFLQILSHDLISPFNTLLGYSELLLSDYRKLEIHEIEDRLNDINKAAQNSYNLLSDILMWTRAQSGKIPFNPKHMNLATTCKDALESLNHNARAKKITINNLATDQIVVFADIDMLKTVLRNLVSNAIKFTGNNGAINISAKEDPEYITISVSDNGIGIKDENRIKLFDISQVVSTSGTASETGTGLGLLICKEFVEKHGGNIWVESNPDKGSDFKFTLPALVEEVIN